MWYKMVIPYADVQSPWLDEYKSGLKKARTPAHAGAHGLSSKCNAERITPLFFLSRIIHKRVDRPICNGQCAFAQSG